MPHPLYLKVMDMTVTEFNAIPPAKREELFYKPAQERLAELQKPENEDNYNRMVNTETEDDSTSIRRRRRG